MDFGIILASSCLSYFPFWAFSFVWDGNGWVGAIIIGMGQSLFCFLFSFCLKDRGERPSDFVWRCISSFVVNNSLEFAVLGRSVWVWCSCSLGWVGLVFGGGVGIPHHTLYTCSTPVDLNVQEQRDGKFGILQGAAAAAGCCWLQLDRNEKQTALT